MNGGYRALDELRAAGRSRRSAPGSMNGRSPRALARAGDFDVFLLAGRYTLLEQEALTSFLPLCAQKSIGVVVGGPFNSGILATGVKADAHYNYGPAPEEVKERVRRIQQVCKSFKVKLPEAALRFPLGHPAVVSVIAGAQRASEAKRNAVNDERQDSGCAMASVEIRKAHARGCARAALSAIRVGVRRALRSRRRPGESVSAAGLRGRPGMVRMSPIRTTTKPAPARRRTSRIGRHMPARRAEQRRIVGERILGLGDADRQASPARRLRGRRNCARTESPAAMSSAP